MWTVYLVAGFIAAWMALGQVGLLWFDRYPFPFLLFLGNVVQLCLIFVILLGQQVLGAASDKRALQTYEDAEAILEHCVDIQAHLAKQDEVLNSGVALFEHIPHPRIEARRLTRPSTVAEHHVGINGKIAAFVTAKSGTMWACYAAAALQVGWMFLAQVGIIKFDPYPFAFMLFLSSLTQLILMFVIMVGQGVLGAAADKRALETYEDAEAVLHECERLKDHLKAQDEVIVRLVRRLEHCAREHATAAALRLPAADSGSSH